MRFAVLTTCLALSVLTTAAAIELATSYFDGDWEAAGPWTYFGAITPFINGATAFFTLRRFQNPSHHSRSLWVP